MSRNDKYTMVINLYEYKLTFKHINFYYIHTCFHACRSVDRTKMAFRIIETKRNKVLSIQYGSAVPGSKITMCAAEGRRT